MSVLDQMTETLRPDENAQDAAADVGSEISSDAPDLEPMTFSLLGRFFLVPLIIISAIVGGAVCVVLLFGGPVTSEQRPIAELLQTLESTTGEKSFGILLPREKELWQTALELSVRLKDKGKESSFSTEELDTVSRRVSSMVNADLAVLDRLAELGGATQVDIRSRRLEFLIRALGRTGRPSAIAFLVELVRSRREPFVQVAMQELVDLRAEPGVAAAIEPMTALLDGASSDETSLVACTCLSVLAGVGDVAVIEALKRVRLRSEGEVEWSAALALARLGSDAGAATLLDLLDRKFLESGDRYHTRDEKSGVVHRYPLPPGQVEQILIAAIDAASNLANTDLWEMIERLKSDPSPAVRGKVAATLKAHGRAA